MTETDTHPATPSSDAPEALRPRFRDALVLAGAATLGLVLLASLLDYGYGRDQGIYAVVADAMLRGEAPYRDAWDFKPPGIYLVFAATEILFGAGQGAIRILEALLLASLFPAFALFAKRHVGDARAGVFGATVALLAVVPLEYWNTAQPETFGGVLLAWALVCATRSDLDSGGHPPSKPRLRSPAVAAGALYCAAALLKPPLGGGILVSAILLTSERRRLLGNGFMRAAWVPVTELAIGGAIPLVATLGYFAAHGALGDLADVLFSYAPQYVSLDFSVSRLPFLLRHAVGDWLFSYTPFTLMGLAPLVILPALAKRERSGCAHALGVIAMSLIGVALQGKFFKYHYASAFALTGLLAGIGYWKLWLLVRGNVFGIATAVIFATTIAATVTPGTDLLVEFVDRSRVRLLALAQPERGDAVHDQLYGQGDVNSADNRASGAWIAQHTPSESTLYVWGFQPVLYDLANRRPASRYLYNLPQRARWKREEARARLLHDLEDAEPAAVVVIHRDSAVFVTVMRSPVDSNRALVDFPELVRWLEDHYVPGTRIGDLEILLRRSNP